MPLVFSDASHRMSDVVVQGLLMQVLGLKLSKEDHADIITRYDNDVSKGPTLLRSRSTMYFSNKR